MPAEERPAFRPEGLSTTGDLIAPEETEPPLREGKVRVLETAPEIEPDWFPAEPDLPVEVQVRLFDVMPETFPVAGLLRVPLDRAPRSARVAREPAAEIGFNAGEARLVRATEGRTFGCSALTLMRPSAPSSEDRRACREIAGDCRRSLRTTVRAREFQG